MPRRFRRSLGLFHVLLALSLLAFFLFFFRHNPCCLLSRFRVSFELRASSFEQSTSTPVRKRLQNSFRGVRLLWPLARRSQLEARSYLSSVVPHFLHTRTLRSPRTSCPTRTGPQVGQTSATFEREIRRSCSAMPPFEVWVGRRCFFTTATCSTKTRPVSGKTRSTRPCFPLSLPLNTFTVSLRRISTVLCAVAVFIKTQFQIYNTSGAKLTIFKNFFSRSSRATGPNTRVPTGSPASLISTA